MKKYLFIPFILIVLSCKDDNRYSYAIKDFRKELQPHLTRMVSRAIVEGYDTAFEKIVTDKELQQLTMSEHPILRAEALGEIMERKLADRMEIIMDHLDDTAIIARDIGEFGIDYIAVSDYMLFTATWDTRADKNKTIEKVLTQHNYLGAAHSLVRDLEPIEKYHPYVKDMATRRKKQDDYTGWEIKYEEREAALYGLAKFKKKEDIHLIKTQLLKNFYRIGSTSFDLMKQFADTSYLEIYEAYYPGNFYRSFNFDQNYYTDFIQSLAEYKNKRSASILQAILDKKDFAMGPVYYEILKDEVKRAAWNNKCEAYETINKQFEKEWREYEKDIIALPPIDMPKPLDTFKREIRWWN